MFNQGLFFRHCINRLISLPVSARTLKITNLRSLSCSLNTMNNNRSFVALEIPTEYGIISAKEWGSPIGRPVLAVHGWQDNAGSFDPLIPWLHPGLRVVAIDLPGHGLSSHRPPGSYYHYMEFLLDMKRVINYLNWRKFTIIGHSMGGGLSVLYAGIFPEEVESVISIDIFKPLSAKVEAIPARTASSIKHHLLIEERMKRPEPVYTEDQALNRLFTAQQGSLTRSSAKVLLKRGVKESEDGSGVVYTRDLRLQVESLQKLDNNTIKSYLSNVQCNYLVIKARKGIVLETAETTKEYKELFSRVCNRFLFVEINGTHHIHMNNPEIVAPLINTFLENSQL